MRRKSTTSSSRVCCCPGRDDRLGPKCRNGESGAIFRNPRKMEHEWWSCAEQAPALCTCYCNLKRFDHSSVRAIDAITGGAAMIPQSTRGLSCNNRHTLTSIPLKNIWRHLHTRIILRSTSLKKMSVWIARLCSTCCGVCLRYTTVKG